MLVIGLRDIGALFGKSAQTAKRWVTLYGLKARRLPDKRWITSLTWIDEWIAAGHATDPLVKSRTAKPIRPRAKKANRQPQDNAPVVSSPDAHKHRRGD